MSKMNWTVKPLVSMISHLRFILLTMDFVKFAWWRAGTIAVADHCCGCTSIKAVKHKTTICGYSLISEPLNCGMFSFPDKLWHNLSVFIQDVIESVSHARWHIDVCSLQLNSLSSDAWTMSEKPIWTWGILLLNILYYVITYLPYSCSVVDIHHTQGCEALWLQCNKI